MPCPTHSTTSVFLASNVVFNVVAPIFTDTVSMEFTCDSSMGPLTCASHSGESGSLLCDFQSDPSGTLSVTIDVADNTSVELVGTRIRIGAANRSGAGNYTCVASNIIRGVERTTTREIMLLVGGILCACIVLNFAKKESGSILRAWKFLA